MASNLELEVFAYNLFYDQWIQMGLVNTKPDIFQIYGEELLKVDDIYKACQNIFIIPGICRRCLFPLRIYLKDLTIEKARSLKSLSDCYEYVISICDRDDLFGHLKVTERMFATCTFVLQFCIFMHRYNNIVDVIKYGHIFWAMYFDKFAQKFYEEGGWDKLKKLAKTYECIIDFLLFLDGSDFRALKEAVDNYWDFTGDIKYDEYKYAQKDVHVSKLWIKYRIEHFEKYTRIPFDYNDPFDARESETLLFHLRELFELIQEEDLEDSEDSSDLNQQFIGLCKGHEVANGNGAADGDQTEIAKKTEILHTSQNGKTPLEFHRPPKVFSTVNQYKNTGDEITNIGKELDDLRKEQNDHDIKIFLRMILVLDDRQGTKFVLQALQSNKDGPEKAEVIPNKRKKKYKQKKSNK